MDNTIGNFVLGQIMYNLFAKAEKKLTEKMQEFVTDNAVALDYSPYGYYISIYGFAEYKSRSNEDDVFPNWQYIDMQEDRMEKFGMMHKMCDDLEREKIVISAYLKDVLNHTIYPADLDFIFPDDVKVFTTIVYNKKEKPSAMAIEYNTEITNNGKKAKQEDIIKQRILSNLLIQHL